MFKHLNQLGLALLVVVAGGRAAAQEISGPVAPAGQSAPVICLSIDTAHDTLTPSERGAALILLGRQFTLSG